MTAPSLRGLRQPCHQGPPTTPPPADLARCETGCGRLAFYADTQRCGVCDTKPRPGKRAA